MIPLTREWLLSFFTYDEQTGDLLRPIGPRNPKLKVAGWINDDGYRQVGINGKTYKVHRLVWFMVKGEWPDKQVDHINGVRTDNRVENLRLADNKQNQQNSKARNKTGFKGVCLKGRKFEASICVDKTAIRLGRFLTPEEAHAAYCKAAELYFGDFARTS